MQNVVVGQALGSQSLGEKRLDFLLLLGVHNLPRETSFLHTKRYNTKQ